MADTERTPGLGARGSPKETSDRLKVDTDPTAWVAAELASVEDRLRAARLTIGARGIIPRPAIRSAAIALVALDAAVTDDLTVVRAMRPEPWAAMS
jgi:hypothetical protein